MQLTHVFGPDNIVQRFGDTRGVAIGLLQARLTLLLPHPLLHKKTRATVVVSLRASNEGLLRPRVARVDFSSFFLPTAAETTIVGRRAETESALTGEGGTQLAAARDRCSS